MPATRHWKATSQHLTTARCGEDLAAEHLRRLGFEVLARNVRTRAGEIDLIAADAETLVFAEVKTTRCRPGQAQNAARIAESVLERLGPHQRYRLRGLALDWLRDGDGSRTARRGQLRFDAIGVALDPAGRLLALEHIEAAW